MNRTDLADLLAQVSEGKLDPASALESLATLPFDQLAHSTLDLHRELRQGTPEVVFGENKTPGQIGDNLARIHQAHGRALATRVSPEKAAVVCEQLSAATYHREAQCLSLGLPEQASPATPEQPYIAIVTAGTSDLSVSEEAALTLQFLGHHYCQINDVGVAGLHRLLPHLATFRQATAIIAIAGMEGALPSVIGGLVGCPVIAVPTSTGYGIARDGETALHAMLTSCASGIAVVNIDNGFGAALFSHTLLRQIQ